MAAFDARLPIAPDVLRGDGPVAWAARNGAKPGRTGPEAWVVQAGADWSRTHLEMTAEAVVAPLLDAFAAHAGLELPAPLSATAHRWRYARSGAAGEGRAVGGRAAPGRVRRLADRPAGGGGLAVRPAPGRGGAGRLTVSRR